MVNKKLRANLLLLLTAFIWGTAFIAQKKGISSISPFAFNGIRNIIGSLALLPVIFYLDKQKPAKTQIKWPWFGGIACGIALFIASSLQQFGIMSSSAGKAGFITALYIVIVPLFGIFLKKRVAPVVWISVFLAAFGMYLLCMQGGFTLEKADFLLLLCAIVFSIHILVIDFFAPYVDCVRMACLQFFVSGVLSLICMLFEGLPDIISVFDAAIPILYAGVLSSGVAYTLQIVAQKDTDPTSASLICSLESVFALLGGFVVMHERFSARELLGCLIMFAAIILSQLPIGKKQSNIL